MGKDLGNIVGAIVVGMGGLSAGSRAEVANEGVLALLIGRSCASCDFIYASEADLREHGTIGGYGRDVVGKGECWSKYVAKYGVPSRTRGNG